MNSQISHYRFAGISLQHKTTRDRKLLLHRKEIKRWNLDVDRKRLSIVPTKIFFSKRLAKAEIALVRGKRKYDRRQSIKNKEAEIEMRRSLKKSRF
jgi:SsrA-binding protein